MPKKKKFFFECMDELKLQFNENITTTKSQLDHIQVNVCVANVPKNERKIWCNRIILAKLSQSDSYCIQITKHTSNV